MGGGGPKTCDDDYVQKRRMLGKILLRAPLQGCRQSRCWTPAAVRCIRDLRAPAIPSSSLPCLMLQACQAVVLAGTPVWKPYHLIHEGGQAELGERAMPTYRPRILALRVARPSWTQGMRIID